MPLGIGVILADLHSTGKIPAVIGPQMIFANLRVRGKKGILFKNKRNILCGYLMSWVQSNRFAKSNAAIT